MKSPVIIPDGPGTHDEGHRVVKLSCSKLAQNNPTLIKILEDMTIKNSQLAVGGSIILNNMVMMCVSENIPVPENFLLNWSFAIKLEHISNQTLRDAVAGRFSYHESDS
jgi:hypothetical protein